MSDKYFLDTNVLAYAFDRKAPEKAKTAQKLVEEALETRRGVISYQVIQEFFNVAFRRFPEPLTADEAQQYLSTVLRRLLRVQSSVGLYSEALHVRERYRLSWYDSLIVAAAWEAKCGVLYTEDWQHGQRLGDLRVINPFRSE